VKERGFWRWLWEHILDNKDIIEVWSINSLGIILIILAVHLSATFNLCFLLLIVPGILSMLYAFYIKERIENRRLDDLFSTTSRVMFEVNENEENSNRRCRRK